MNGTDNIDNFLLTESVTVGQVRCWIANKEESSKKELIDLTHHLLYNRYIKHIETIDSGFLKMAISCLMIETFESFVQGIEDSSRRSKKIFTDFFSKKESLFHGFEAISDDFYKNIRCGILHQSDTTNGWRVISDGILLDVPNRTINASEFVNTLSQALKDYVSELQDSEFNSKIWQNAIRKIEAICQGCIFPS